MSYAGRYRRKSYARRRPSTRKYKRRSMPRATYKQTRSIIKKVMYQQLETKRHTQTFTNTLFAANGSVTGTDGHALINITMPSVGTAQNQRIGNKIKVQGLTFHAQYQSTAAGGVNYPLTGRIYLLQYKDGGTAFPIGNFLENDPNRSSITYNSIRNPDMFTDFIVLRSIKIRLSQDQYQSNNDSKSIQFGWKGNIPVTISSSTPQDNSLFMLFVADIGFTSSAGGNAVNAFLLNGQSIIYYKDA